MRKVWIAMPAYSGQMHMATGRSLYSSMIELAARGDHAMLYDECGNALLADARAVMVANFLASDFDTFVFIDNDVCWEAGALLRLIDQPVDFRVGIYPQRKDPINFCVRYDETQRQIWSDKNGLISVWGAPAGFMVMSRQMLERMSEHYSDLSFWCDTAVNKKAVALFADYWIRDVALPDGTRGNLKLGEDYAFCQRWLDMGGKVYVDPEITFGHIGYKTFQGRLGDWLRAQTGEQEEA